MNATKLTRHDIPASVKNLMVVAQEALGLDIFDIYELAASFGGDWRGLTDELCNYGFASSHDGRGTHAKIVKAAEMVWAEIL